MKIGVRAFPDNVEEMSKLDVDYFEAAVRDELDIKAYHSIEDKIWGIHGAILHQDVNFMDPWKRKSNNSVAIKNALYAARKFSQCKYIVFHPGYIEKGDSGDFCSLINLIDLMRKYDNKKLHLEVVPVFAYEQRLVFPVHSVDDYKRLKQRTRKNFVLDLGHAMITARAMKYDPVDYISELIEGLDIRIMHIADNDEKGDGYEDSHLHIGEGNVPIEQILKKYKHKVEFATIEVNGVTTKDIELVRSYIS